MYTSRYTITLSGFPAPYLGIYEETLKSKSSANPEQEKRIIIKAFYLIANCISTANIWFINQVHQALMIITALLTVTGVAFAFIYVGHWSEVITTECNFTLTNYCVVRNFNCSFTNTYSRINTWRGSVGIVCRPSPWGGLSTWSMLGSMNRESVFSGCPLGALRKLSHS